MHPYRAMLQQILEGRLSPNAIANQRNMSHHTVRRARRIAVEAALSRDRLDRMDDAAIRAMFGPSRLTEGASVEPDVGEELALLRKGFNRLEAHGRYVERVGEANALAYRTYCKRIANHLRTLDPVMSLDHAPGYALQVDFAGYQPQARETPASTPCKYKLFIAALPFSRFMAAEIVHSEKVADLITAHVSVLHRLGGAPIVLVPDNLKSAIISRPRFGPPRVQSDYQSFADHYGLGVVPARVGEPQDKSAVENAVKLIQRSLRLRFIDRPVPLLGELREALADMVARWNARIMRRANGHSRLTLFESEERVHLRPLPAEPYRRVDLRRSAVVGRDYHVPLQGNAYSVPHHLVGKTVSILADAATVRILSDNRQVALHPRLFESGRRSTEKHHMPDGHRWYAEQDLVNWAREYDPAVRQIAALEMAKNLSGQVRKQRTQWVRDLPRIHGRKRFEAACRRAIAAGDSRFEHVANVLKRGIESAPVEARRNRPIDTVSNVRGPEYYEHAGEGQ